jgi:hypothetical protein
MRFPGKKETFPFSAKRKLLSTLKSPIENTKSHGKSQKKRKRNEKAPFLRAVSLVSRLVPLARCYFTHLRAAVCYLESIHEKNDEPPRTDGADTAARALMAGGVDSTDVDSLFTLGSVRPAATERPLERASWRALERTAGT